MVVSCGCQACVLRPPLALRLSSRLAWCLRWQRGLRRPCQLLRVCVLSLQVGFVVAAAVAVVIAVRCQGCM